jgi:hypothetical protein
MSRLRRLRSWLLLMVGCVLLLAAMLWRPPLHRELIVFAVVALMLAVSSFLQRYMTPQPPPSGPY